MKEQKKAPRLVLYFRPWEPSTYDTEATHYRLSILMVEEGRDTPSNISRTSHEYKYPGIGVLEDLQIECYLSWYNGQFQAGSFSVLYHGSLYLERIEEAEQMVRGLKRAEKIRKAFPVQPQTFGQYAVLMASGFDVKECCRERDQRSGSFYTDHDWQYLPLSYAQEWIDAEIARIRKLKVGSAEEAA